MAEKYNQESDNRKPGVSEIDLIEIVKKLWSGRMLILKWCAVSLVLGLIVAFSIPKEYSTQVKLAPELGDANKVGSNLGALAAMAGIGVTSNGSDAVYPMLYPDIIHSVPFSLALLDIPVVTEEGDKPIKLSDYLDNDVKSPWWDAVISIPWQLIDLMRSSDEDLQVNSGNNPFHLTEDEDNEIKELNDRISCLVDENTSVVTISVTMQDPMVSAILADTVANRLKEYVTEYRTNKSRKDLQYVEMLTEEAKEEYYSAQQRYARYLDTHQGIVMYSAQTMRDRLENEATLAFNIYNQMSQKLEFAKAKVQEETPVFATIEPATVPLKATSPRKVIILAIFIFLGFAGACAWIVVLKSLGKKFKSGDTAENSTSEKASAEKAD
ncbi:MAG: chain-length determining protein [Muribaculaceae bacterium]|nr:chain-length determining protein [Muribaculaceae bacterium]